MEIIFKYFQLNENMPTQCKNQDSLLDSQNPDLSEILYYCRKGGRSALAVKTLQELGYTNIFDLEGGINAWGEQGNSLYNWHGEIKVAFFDKKDPNQARSFRVGL